MPSLAEALVILPRQRGNVDTAEEGIETDKGDSLSGGAIAGIVVGVVAAVALLLTASWWFVTSKRRREMKDIEAQKKMSVDGRSSVGTRPSNVAAPMDEPQIERNTAVAEPRDEVDPGNIQPPPEAATHDGPARY